MATRSNNQVPFIPWKKQLAKKGRVKSVNYASSKSTSDGFLHLTRSTSRTAEWKIETENMVSNLWMKGILMEV
jgi:hypothetical protein